MHKHTHKERETEIYEVRQIYLRPRGRREKSIFDLCKITRGFTICSLKNSLFSHIPRNGLHSLVGRLKITEDKISNTDLKSMRDQGFPLVSRQGRLMKRNWQGPNVCALCMDYGKSIATCLQLVLIQFRSGSIAHTV